jgi:hypothetical protein
MTAETLRIDALRRRVRLDPASTAFAPLAEHCRRSGRLEEAIEICRAGLTRHAAFTDARMTLCWALVEAGRLAEAAGEADRILQTNPEHLTAVWALAEIDTCRDDPDHSLRIPGRTAWPRTVLALETFLGAIQAARRPPVAPAD